MFLCGMRLMSEGIRKRAGDRLESVLQTAGENRLAAVLTGTGVTAVIQSSSAATVLLVSLVNAGLVSLRQSIGMVMGANIGTTFTAWAAAFGGFRLSAVALGLALAAFALPLSFSRRTRLREIADILMGSGLFFLGLHFMIEAVPDIPAGTRRFGFPLNWNPSGYPVVLLFAVLGSLLTMAVQTSTAATVITMITAFRGWIPFPAAAAAVLGQNIGTAVTALAASASMNAAARRTARAHMLFNLIGMVWMLIVFRPYIAMVERILPGNAGAPGAVPLHLAMFHTLFNVTNTLLLIGFITPLARLVNAMVPDDSRQSRRKAYELKLVPGNLEDATAANLITIRRELAIMAGEIYKMLMMVMNGARDPEWFEGARDELSLSEQRVDAMQEQIITYLIQCTRGPLGADQSRSVAGMSRIANELESVADSTFGIGLLMNKLHKKGWYFHEQGDEELIDYTSRVLDFLKYNEDFLSYRLHAYDLELAREMEEGIDKMRDKLRRRSRRSIERDDDVDVKGELIFMDMVRFLEHIGDSAFNVSEAIVALPG